MELAKLKRQVDAVNRCASNLESAKAELKVIIPRKLHYPTCREYNQAVANAEENINMAQSALDTQIKMNVAANGFTKEMEDYA